MTSIRSLTKSKVSSTMRKPGRVGKMTRLSKTLGRRTTRTKTRRRR